MDYDGNEHPVPNAPGYRFRAYPSVGSTNALAMETARAGDPGGLWIIGAEQTAGRARRGRAWTSEKGNFYASLLLIDPGPSERVGELPMVAAVALADAVEKACGVIGVVKLKWPNDLLIEGRKISGILLEALTLEEGRRAIVCGFGVNCAHHPDLGLYPAGDLAGFGFRVTPEMVFLRVANTISERLEAWSYPGGFAKIRTDWLHRAVGLGERINVRYPDREIAGVFLGLEMDGRLRLRLDNGEIDRISAGDVFFGE
ncbi:biotin--[acetyl-CoA-carboxylase] ligase [Rhizobiales bacterium]|uniref:biotin--[acetyl-CoA-carboxylase] ligase n=1 Tax=Hongsoonwoonella zoysiae TaxID=2821844 RepID=UPI0015612EEA|nr:biotin--[acetyl-CoA-carboxylase] ligase [Hongsoonwoonella zoysiae]NRG18684.1 biotin--[acetyl-CoA-carboxylase] ligase [Hongsoonwoonella zoysiae]